MAHIRLAAPASMLAVAATQLAGCEVPGDFTHEAVLEGAVETTQTGSGRTITQIESSGEVDAAHNLGQPSVITGSFSVESSAVE